jgi:hypothetical protein
MRLYSSYGLLGDSVKQVGLAVSVHHPIGLAVAVHHPKVGLAVSVHHPIGLVVGVHLSLGIAAGSHS